MTMVRHVLCPVDFSETSEQALRVAWQLASRLQASLTVLHLYEPLSHIFPEDAVLDEQRIIEQTKRAAYQSLQEMMAKCLPPTAKPIPALAEGRSYTAIVEQAERLGADMIVLGTHGRTGVAHALLGSVAERVVRSSPIPVVTVRAPG